MLLTQLAVFRNTVNVPLWRRRERRWGKVGSSPLPTQIQLFITVWLAGMVICWCSSIITFSPPFFSFNCLFDSHISLSPIVSCLSFLSSFLSLFHLKKENIKTGWEVWLCVRKYVPTLLGISGAAAKNNLHQNPDILSMSFCRKSSQHRGESTREMLLRGWLSMCGCRSACMWVYAVQECVSAYAAAVRWVCMKACSLLLYCWSPATPQHWFKQAASEGWKLTDLEKGWKRERGRDILFEGEERTGEKEKQRTGRRGEEHSHLATYL